MTTTTTTATGTTARPKGTGRQPSEQAIDAAIDAATRLLRLPTFRERYSEIADAAGREQLSYRGFLSELLLAECDDRDGWNDRCEPFIWTKTADDIIGKARPRQTTSNTRH